MMNAPWRKRVSIWSKRLYLYPAPEPLPRSRLFWVALGLVTLAVVVFSTYFIIYLTSLQNAFQTNAEDMGIMDQAIWNTLHGQILHQTICNILNDTNCAGFQGVSRFAIHFEPILFPVSWFYLLWSDPRMLQVLQTLVVAAGAYPAFWLARLRLRNELAAVAIAVLYLFYPAQQQATASDFHAVTFTASLLLFTLYFMYTRRTVWIFVFAVLALACKEEIGVIIVMFGLWSMLFQRSWRSGLALVVLGGLWFVLANFVIIPHFSPTGHGMLIGRYTGVLQNKGPVQGLLGLLTHPIWFVHQYILEHDHFAYLRTLFAPAGFLPLFAPWVLILALPSIAGNLLSSDIQQYSGLFHYNAEIVPALIFSTIEALVLILWLAQRILTSLQVPLTAPVQQRARFVAPRRLIHGGLLVALLGLTIISSVHYDETFFGKMPFSKGFQWPTVSAHTALAQHFIDMVPSDASVSAQTKFVPHLSHRVSIYMFPYGTPFDKTNPASAAQAEYILLDVSGDIYPYGTSLDYVNAVKTILLSGDYGVVAAQDGYLLLKRGLTPPGVSPYSALPLSKVVDQTQNYLVLPNLPSSLCSGIYMPTVKSQVQATFTAPGGTLNLLDFSVSAADPFSRSSGMTVTTDWQVTGSLSTPLQMLFLMTGNDGQEYFASTDVPQLYWCQTNTWKPGSIVRLTSRIFTLSTSTVPYGLAHLSMALVPLVQSSGKIMDVQTRLPVHIVSTAATITATPGTNALQIKRINVIP